MAMKMDRRAFLKTSAAVAVAVSMTGLLGGCGERNCQKDGQQGKQAFFFHFSKKWNLTLQARS